MGTFLSYFVISHVECASQHSLERESKLRLQKTKRLFVQISGNAFDLSVEGT